MAAVTVRLSRKLARIAERQTRHEARPSATD